MLLKSIISYANLLILFLSLAFSYTSFIAKDWLQFSYDQNIYQYNFFLCEECPKTYLQTSHFCLIKECNSKDNWLCEIGRSSENMKKSIIYTEYFNLIIVILLIERVFYNIINKNSDGAVFGRICVILLIISK